MTTELAEEPTEMELAAIEAANTDLDGDWCAALELDDAADDDGWPDAS